MIFCRLHLRELCYNSTPKGKILEYPQPYINIGVLTRSNKGAFYNCSSLKTVYYAGTADDWAKIDIGDYNYGLFSATRYYYSETKPALNSDGTAYDGNYWHYDNGEVVIWTK